MATKLDSIDPYITKVIRSVEKKFVSKNYETIKGKIAREDIAKIVTEYSGKEITFAPKDYYEKLQLIEIKDSSPRQCLVDFDLWFGGKQSDLTASLSITMQDDGDHTVELENLHIM